MAIKTTISIRAQAIRIPLLLIHFLNVLLL